MQSARKKLMRTQSGEEAFAERNRINQAFFDGKLIAYAEVLRLLGEDLEENDGYERN